MNKEQTEVLISELAGKTHDQISALIWKMSVHGGDEGRRVMALMSDLSQI